MRIELIHPPHPNSTDDRLDPPMGLLYIAAHLEQHGIEVGITDLSGIEQKSWKIPIADIYGLTVYVSSLEITEEIVKRCKDISPKSIMVVGGAHPSACPNDFPYADHVVVGLGESAMLRIAMGQENNHIIIGTEPTDYFLFPAFHLVDSRSYHRRIAGKRSFPFLTSRGCPFKCAFCGLNRMHELGFGIKMATPETVAYQIKRIKEEFGIDRINFQDDIFTLNPSRLDELLRLIKPLKIKFRCMGRAGYDTEETYRRLAEAGCDQVSWGIESGSQYMLDRMNKQVTVEDNYNVIQWTKKYGITSRTFFIIGFPGETEDTLEATKQFIEEADPDQYFVSNFVPYLGTDVWNDPWKYGVINLSKDFDQYYQVSKDGTGGTVIDTEWLTRKEFKELELRFRSWLKSRPMRKELQDYERKREDLYEAEHSYPDNDVWAGQEMRRVAD